jgi:hypothetical protein
VSESDAEARLFAPLVQQAREVARAGAALGDQLVFNAHRGGGPDALDREEDLAKAVGDLADALRALGPDERAALRGRSRRASVVIDDMDSILRDIVGALHWGEKMMSPPAERGSFTAELHRLFRERFEAPLWEAALSWEQGFSSADYAREKFALEMAQRGRDEKLHPTLSAEAGRERFNQLVAQVGEVFRYGPVEPRVDDELTTRLGVAVAEVEQWLGELEAASAGDRPKDSPAKATIDEAEAVIRLRKKSRTNQARLVEMMIGRQVASVEDVARDVHGDAEAEEATIRQNVSRTNTSLIELNCRTRYRIASGYVHKDTSPE